MNRKLLVVGAIALALVLAGCDQSVDVPDISTIVGDYPSVDGSTSARPLQRMLACTILGVECVWSERGDLDGVHRSIIPDPEREQSPQSVELIYSIRHHGTHGSYMNLIEGQADFILVARLPSEDELKTAQEKNVVLDVRAIALDAFVFLVNVQNSIDDLELETVRDIYTGKITNWRELGVSGKQSSSGFEGPIHTFQRNRNSGSQELMESLVMKGAPMVESPDMILESMVGPINAIGGDPWGEGEDPLGIGYSVYYYASFIFPHTRVKLIGIDGVKPTSENIAKRSYPLTTEVYAVVREDMPQDSTAVILLNWLLTEEGQAAVKETGYVPIR